MPGQTRLRLTSLLSAAIVLFTFTSTADAQIRFDLPAQPLSQALTTLGSLANLNIYFDATTVEGIQAPALKAELSANDALARLLAGTRLRAVRVDENTVRVIPDEALKRVQGAHDNNSGALNPPSNVHLAYAGTAASARAGTSAEEDSGEGGKTNPQTVSEVLVTAERREERLQDVPMSLTALTGEQLAASQSFRFEDYTAKVPGLTLVNYGAIGSQLVIRGLTTGNLPINSTVATYLDETPYTGVGIYAGSYLIAPNLDTFDMQRIEVLKGPQGTLYGANALGGVLRYVTNTPNPERFAATVEGSGNTVSHGSTGFDTHGMVNIPLGSDMAVRLVGYDTYYPGFIDDPSRGLTNINGSHVSGGRASLAWAPDASLSIRLNALYQRRTWADWPNEDVQPNTFTPVYGNLIQEDLIGQPGRTTNQVYNLTANWDAGFAKLVSTTSYADFATHLSWDYSKILGPTLTGALGMPVGFVIDYSDLLHAFTQEVRLTSREHQTMQWQVGAFYTNQSSLLQEPAYLVDVPTRSVLYDFLPTADHFPAHYRELAGFVDLDYTIVPTLDVAVGGRYSNNHQFFSEVTTGLAFGENNFSESSSESSWTYSADVRWRPTQEATLYARVASGFAPGGPNNVSPVATVPHTYSSSTTVNYEAGIKSSWLENHLTAELSAFAVQWRDIQLAAIINGYSSTMNGGSAHSGGIEWSFAYIPVQGLSLGFNGAYTHAYLTAPTPTSVGGQDGDRLPGVPLIETSFSSVYERPLSASYTGFVGLDWRYMGDRYANFEPVGPRQLMPSYHIVDVRAGLNFQRWTVAIYAKNVGDKIAINYVQDLAQGALGPQSATVYTPRTIGGSLTVNF
jgi:outer membrane receptor protein involved in Fe transport